MWDMERRPITVAERIQSCIEIVGHCWIWEGPMSSDMPALPSPTGYVKIIPLFWEQKNGPVPEGEVLICIHPRSGPDACVNPAHYRSGAARGPDQCRAGHDLSNEANVWYSGGTRYCLLCMTRRKVGKPGPRLKGTT